MSRDYAKRKKSTRKTNTRKTTPRKKSAQKKQRSPILFFFSGILLTLLVVLGWLYFSQPELVKGWFAKAKTSAEAAIEKVGEENKPATNKDEQLNYHEILTNKELEVEKDPAAALTNSNRKYIIQCGASKVLSKAEAMKVQIAFIGLQAQISEKNGWYRVQLGPYSSKRAAESDRHKLQNNNFNDCRIW